MILPSGSVSLGVTLISFSDVCRACARHILRCTHLAREQQEWKHVRRGVSFSTVLFTLEKKKCKAALTCFTFSSPCGGKRFNIHGCSEPPRYCDNLQMSIYGPFLLYSLGPLCFFLSRLFSRLDGLGLNGQFSFFSSREDIFIPSPAHRFPIQLPSK